VAFLTPLLVKILRETPLEFVKSLGAVLINLGRLRPATAIVERTMKLTRFTCMMSRLKGEKLRSLPSFRDDPHTFCNLSCWTDWPCHALTIGKLYHTTK